MKIDSDLSDLFKTDSDWSVGFAPTNFKAYIASSKKQFYVEHMQLADCATDQQLYSKCSVLF